MTTTFARATKAELLKLLAGLSPRTVATQATCVRHPLNWQLDPVPRLDISSTTLTFVFSGVRLWGKPMCAFLHKEDGSKVSLVQGDGHIELTRTVLEEEWTELVFEFV